MSQSVDFHHNLFYCYRGPSTNTSDHAPQVDRDRQLENNLTKALINTLALGGIKVYQPFLKELGIPNVLDAKFIMHRRNLPSGTAANKKNRVLLCIFPKQKADETDTGAIATYESVPDAWVYGDGFAVLIESKVNEAAVSKSQIAAHRAQLSPSPTNEVKKTWGEIHQFFTKLSVNMQDASPAKLLVEQLIEYLEYSGMSEFTAFCRAHFDYFLQHDDDDVRRWIHDQMNSLATKVKDSLPKEIKEFYAVCDVGILKRTDTSCWVAFGKTENAYRQETHQTMSLSYDGLRVFVNTELKTATDQLKRVLADEQPAAEFRNHLRHLPEPFELVLEERTQRQASLYDYTPKMRLHSSILKGDTSAVAWTAFVNTVNLLELPYLRIERLVPAQGLLKNTIPAVDRVAEIIRSNHAVVCLLNGKT